MVLWLRLDIWGLTLELFFSAYHRINRALHLILTIFNMLLIDFFVEASVYNFGTSGQNKLMLFLCMPMKIKSVFIRLLLLLPFFAHAQQLDSLLIIAQQTKNDSVRARLYNKVGFGYIFNDSETAKTVLLEGLLDAKNSHFAFGTAELTNTYGIYMDVMGQSDSAKYYFEKALKLSRNKGFQSIESMCVNNLGMFNWNQGNYQVALDYFFQALKMYEAINNEKATGSSLNNIGLIYQEMNLNEKALTYHQKALKIREKYQLENDQVSSLNNIGINLKELGRIEEAISTYKKGIALATRTHNLIEYYRLLDNLGSAYSVKGEYDLSIATFLKALDKPEGYQINETQQLSLYNNLTSMYNQRDQPETALLYATKGLELVKKYPHIETSSADLHINTAETHYMLGNITNARTHIKTYVKLKDALFSTQNAKAIADLEVKYDTEKKEKEILVQRAELAEHKLTIQQKNYQLYGLVGVVLVLGLMGYLLYSQQKLKNRQLQKENELKGALLKIETQNRLQEQRLRISRDLHDNIGAQLTFIISSIDNLKYGFDIKDDALNSKLNAISEFTSATIYELRDTIWAMNKNEISLEDLQTRISNFVEKANASAEHIQFDFNYDPAENGQLKFSSVEGMNIYRIIQESVNNAIKYAEAGFIEVKFTPKKEGVEICITDDGKGFDLEKTNLGNGIANMKKRASDIAATLHLFSQAGQGTVVRLTKDKLI